MGHSEGGATILLAQLSKYSGVISIGSFCSGAEVRVDKQVSSKSIKGNNINKNERNETVWNAYSI